MNSWVIDIGNIEGKTDFNIFDISLNTSTYEHLQHNEIKECLTFSSYEDALEYSITLKEKYFDKKDRLIKKYDKLIKKYTQNLKNDRLIFDRHKKLDTLNQFSVKIK